jgi:hypothetical protein
MVKIPVCGKNRIRFWIPSFAGGVLLKKKIAILDQMTHLPIQSLAVVIFFFVC